MLNRLAKKPLQVTLIPSGLCEGSPRGSVEYDGLDALPRLVCVGPHSTWWARSRAERTYFV